MKITVASGKGATGKTTFAVNLAYALVERGMMVRLLDCDVEEPKAHLFVKPWFQQKESVKVIKPEWDKTLCTACGECANACRYNAIAIIKDKVLIFKELCHSCGVCFQVCPEKALVETHVEIGRVEIADRKQRFFFAHGILNIGEAMAPAVIRMVKKHIAHDAINILNALSGTSCSLVETVADSDVAVLVTEPTPLGLGDLKLALGLTLKEKVPTGIVINRSDGTDALVGAYAERIGVPVIGRIPFKHQYAEAYSSGQILTDRFPEFKEKLLGIYQGIEHLAGTVPPTPRENDAFDIKTVEVHPPAKIIAMEDENENRSFIHRPRA